MGFPLGETKPQQLQALLHVFGVVRAANLEWVLRWPRPGVILFVVVISTMHKRQTLGSGVRCVVVFLLKSHFRFSVLQQLSAIEETQIEELRGRSASIGGAPSFDGAGRPGTLLRKHCCIVFGHLFVVAVLSLLLPIHFNYNLRPPFQVQRCPKSHRSQHKC